MAVTVTSKIILLPAKLNCLYTCSSLHQEEMKGGIEMLGSKMLYKNATPFCFLKNPKQELQQFSHGAHIIFN